MKSSVVGLVLGEEWIKAVEITADLKIAKIGKIKIPVVAGQSEDMKQQLYIAKIKELFHDLKLSKENVVINFRGCYVIARTYMPPSSDKETFEQWFVNNIEQIVPGTNIEDVMYAYNILPSGRALIAFARLREIEKQLAMLKHCNIMPSLIDASCLALYDVFSTHPWVKAKKNFAILDVDNSQSDLLIIKKGEPFGSNVISCTRKELFKGRNFRQKFATEIGVHLARIFTYYAEKESIKISDLIIVGDYKNIFGLKKYLKNNFGLTIEIGNPFRYYQFTGVPKCKKENTYYAQAIGLALKGLSKTGIDLMPHEAKKMRAVFFFSRRIKKFAWLSLFFAFPILVAIIYLLIFISRSNSDMLQRITELKNKNAELASINAQESLLKNRVQRLKGLNHNRFNWSKILYCLGKAVPAGLYFKEISTDVKLVSNGLNPERQIRITIDGQSQDYKNVLDFIKNLEVEFKEIAIENIKGEGQCEFTISLGL